MKTPNIYSHVYDPPTHKSVLLYFSEWGTLCAVLYDAQLPEACNEYPGPTIDFGLLVDELGLNREEWQVRLMDQVARNLLRRHVSGELPPFIETGIERHFREMAQAS